MFRQRKHIGINISKAFCSRDAESQSEYNSLLLQGLVFTVQCESLLWAKNSTSQGYGTATLFSYHCNTTPDCCGKNENKNDATIIKYQMSRSGINK